MEAQANRKLRALGEPEMTLEEAVGLRLYTGPLFVKYNSVLRGLNSKVDFLQKQLVASAAQPRCRSSLLPARSASCRPKTK